MTSWNERVLSAASACGSLLLFGAIGVSVFGALQLAWNPEAHRFASQNALSPGMLLSVSVVAALGGLITLVGAGGYLLVRRTREAIARLAWLGRVACPLLLTIAIPYLFNWRVFADKPALHVAFVLLVSIGVERALRVSFRALGSDRLSALYRRLTAVVPSRLHTPLPAVVLAACIAAFAIALASHALEQHDKLATTAYDLGIFDNMMWNLMHGHGFSAYPEIQDGTSHLGIHATIVALLFVPLYAISPGAEVMLVLQAILCALAALPIYLIGLGRLRSRPQALLLACFYLAFAPIQQAMMYDFHFSTLAPFFVGWAMWSFESNRRWLTVVLFALALLLREDVAATVAMASLVYLISGRRVVWAGAGAALGGVYFVLMKFVVMPWILGGHVTFTALYGHLATPEQPNAARVLVTILLNPVYTLETLLWPGKLLLVGMMCVPVLFLPFRHRTAWLLLLPAMLFSIMTSAQPAFSTAFHHVSMWTAYLFIASAWVLSDWREKPTGWYRVPAVMGAMVLAGAAMSYQHGLFFQRHTFFAGFRRVEFGITQQDREDHDALYALISMIPEEASVTATEREVPHVSARWKCFALRTGNPSADYLLMRVEEAKREEVRPSVEPSIVRGEYGHVASRGPFDLWKRGHSTGGNAAAAGRLGIDIQ